MSWRPRIFVVLALLAFLPAPVPLCARQPKEREKLKEDAYYEFRGHMSDRNTIDRTFTLGWDKGSQVIAITSETKIFRHGRAAKLEETKAGDAVRGIGQAKGRRLVAFAVAFGEEGVELPSFLKVPESITLPPSRASD